MIRLFTAALLLFVTPPAAAQDTGLSDYSSDSLTEMSALSTNIYEQDELEITSAAPSGLSSSDHLSGVRAVWTGNTTVPHSGQDMEWPAVKANGTTWANASGVPYLYCKAWWIGSKSLNVYGYRWKFIKASWPSTWPTSVFCRADENGDSIEIEVFLVPSIRPASEISTAYTSVTLGSGGSTLTGKLYAESTTNYGMTRHIEGSGFVTAILPAGSYTDSCVQARSGTSAGSSLVAGKWCRIEEVGAGAVDLIRLEYDKSANASTAYCHFNGTYLKVGVTKITNP